MPRCEQCGCEFWQDSELPIDETWLESVGFQWRKESSAFLFRHHRLYVLLRTSGQWWLEFDASYCGKVGTYNRLKTRGDVRLTFRAIAIPLHERPE